MKKSLIIAAIVLAVGIPAATIAHKQLICRDHASVAKSADSCCPATTKPAADAATPAKGEACPYMGGKATPSAGTMPKSCPMTATTKPSAKPAARKTSEAGKPAPSKTHQTVKTPAIPVATKTETKVSTAKTVESAVCPVMGSTIPDVSKAAGHSVYKGKTYYFCCGGCKPQFDKDPAKYVGG